MSEDVRDRIETSPLPLGTRLNPGISNTSKYVAISAGGLHGLAPKNDGTIVAWGDNSSGECDVPANLRDVKAISAGGAFSLALKNDGNIVCWGDNFFGQCDVPAG